MSLSEVKEDREAIVNGINGDTMIALNRNECKGITVEEVTA